jgi:hypothetical protein
VKQWGFMAASGSIGDNSAYFTGPLRGIFTITDPATTAATRFLNRHR